LSCLRSLDFHINVVTTDGTPLLITSRGTISTPFYVPDVSHVTHLTMNLLFANQLIDSGCRVIFTLILALSRIIARRLWLELALSAMTFGGFGS
jgi:hypothetical protein